MRRLFVRSLICTHLAVLFWGAVAALGFEYGGFRRQLAEMRVDALVVKRNAKA